MRELRHYLRDNERELRAADNKAYEELARAVHVWRLKNEQQYRIESYHILTVMEDGSMEVLPLHMNAGQWKIWNAIQRQKAANRPVRIVLLKARQFGGSTLIALYLFDETIMHKNMSAFILSYEKESSAWLFDMYKRAYDHMETSVLHRPEHSKKAAMHWRFDSIGSQFRIGTGQNLDVGASTTINHLHISEMPRFPDADAAMSSIINTVPKRPNTSIFIESTAEISGDMFHGYYRKAVDPNIYSEYIGIFVGWNEIDKYSMPFVDTHERNAFISKLYKYEEKLAETYNLTLEQLFWRRFKLEEMGSENEFRKQYPINDEECFLSAGENRFDAHKVNLWKIGAIGANEKKPPMRWVVRPDGRFDVSERHGPFWMYEDAEQYCGSTKHPREYIIGVDVSEGKKISRDGKERDDSVIQVCKRGNMAADHMDEFKTLRQVAKWSGKIEPIELASVIYHIQARYNRALVVVECNGPGGTVLDYLNRYLNCPFLYTREITDKITQETSKVLGWHTSENSKIRAIDTLAQMVNDDEIEIVDPITLEQMLSFKRDDRGHCEAASGCKDDEVMSIGILCAANMNYAAFKQPRDSERQDNTFKKLLALPKNMMKAYGKGKIANLDVDTSGNLVR